MSRRHVVSWLSAIALMIVAAHPAVADRPREALRRIGPALTAELQEKGLSLGAPVYIRIFKETSELELWAERSGSYVHFKTYPICYFSGNLGPKVRKGDNQAPEGFYSVRPSQLNPVSQFHLAMNVGYPNELDRAERRTGSAIMIHGNCVSIGCFAMTDALIEEIYSLVAAALKGGQPAVPVHIFPFRMTAENMKRFASSRWIDFWKQLEPGYAEFEAKRIPPKIVVRNKRYELVGERRDLPPHGRPLP